MATEGVQTTDGTATGVHRILVVANETVGARELLDEIGRHTRGRRTEVKVIAPALIPSRVKQALGDVDDARVVAQARLEKSVQAISRLGVEVSGEIGDSDPTLAIEDALRTFPADELIISTHTQERSTWLEKDVVERAQRELSLPITHVVVDMQEAGSGKVRLIERVQPRSRKRRSDEQMDYLPPLQWRDRITLIVGIVGTIVLGILVLTCSDGGSFSGGCAVRAAIAIGAFMITLWHSVALLLMGSVRYRGFWNDAAADMVLFGIPPAVIVSLLVA
jgi:hypothetical protein